MDVGNLRTITKANLRLNIKQTLFPAILLLAVIPLVYGTVHLDSTKSADCLERMAALIGIPLFVPLLKPEQNGGMDAVLTMRPVPYRVIVVLRLARALLGTAALLFAFEGYMRLGGCSFPVGVYLLRTLVAAMALGFVGLLASAASGNTAVGLLVSFCWYGALQVQGVGAAFACVAQGPGWRHALLLAGSGAGILLLAGRVPHKGG